MQWKSYWQDFKFECSYHISVRKEKQLIELNHLEKVQKNILSSHNNGKSSAAARKMQVYNICTTPRCSEPQQNQSNLLVRFNLTQHSTLNSSSSPHHSAIVFGICLLPRSFAVGELENLLRNDFIVCFAFHIRKQMEGKIENGKSSLFRHFKMITFSSGAWVALKAIWDRMK